MSADSTNVLTSSDILQADATVITGVLIFLTIAPYSRSAVEQIIERKAVLGTILGILILLTGSVATILFSSTSSGLFQAKIFFVIGLFLIAIATFLILLALPQIRKEQKGQDEHQ